jgi:outer membrane protein
MVRWLLLILLVLLSFQRVSAQKKWELEDCIRYAVTNNLDIRSLTLDVRRSSLNYNQALWNISPAVEASGSLGYNLGKTVVEGNLVDNNYLYNDYRIGASMQVFDGFSLLNQISYSRYKRDAARNRKLNVIDNLAFEIMNHYFDVIYYQELLKINREQKELSDIIARKTEALLNAGLKSSSDLLEVKANLEKDILTCIQTENYLAASWIKLKKSMNLSPDSTITLSENRIDSPGDKSRIKDSKNLFDAFSSWSPVIKESEADLAASRKNLGIKRSAFFPTIGANASTGTYYYSLKGFSSDYSRNLSDNQNQYLGLSLRLPVFNRRSNAINMKLARIDVEAAMAKLEQTKRDTYFDVITTCNELKAALGELAQSGKQLEADTLAYQAAEKKYSQGMINVVDFYTTKNRLANTKGQLLRSELTAVIKSRIIDFYQGNRFWQK